MSLVSMVPPHELVLMDADRLFRESLAEIIRNEKFEITQLAGSPGELSLELLAESSHPILVADVQQDEEKVLKFFSEAKKIQPNLKIMVVSRFASPETINACIEIGVHAFLSKNISSESFRNYLLFVALDEKVMPIELAKSLYSSGHDSSSSAMPRVDNAVNFSPRERAILGYLIEGHSNKSIARRLDIADGTVKVGVKSILRKIKATNRTQAAIWALQHGFLEMNTDRAAHLQKVNLSGQYAPSETAATVGEKPVELRTRISSSSKRLSTSSFN